METSWEAWTEHIAPRKHVFVCNENKHELLFQRKTCVLVEREHIRLGIQQDRFACQQLSTYSHSTPAIQLTRAFELTARLPNVRF